MAERTPRKISDRQLEGRYEDAPQPEPVVETVEGPRPYRVETFEAAENEWRWRLADALGNVVEESEETWTTQLQALQGSRSVGREQGAVFLDDPQPR